MQANETESSYIEVIQDGKKIEEDPFCIWKTSYPSEEPVVVFKPESRPQKHEQMDMEPVL